MHWLEKWFFPPCCVVTSAPTDQLDLDPKFVQQWQRYGDACPCCGTHSPKGKICRSCEQGSPRLIEQTHIAFAFRGELRQLVHQFKYHQQLHLSRLFATLIQQQLQLNPVDALVPIPLHPSRLAQRGYNQAYEIARILSKDLGIPIYQGLIRAQATPSQTRLSRSQRQQNISHAFAINPKAEAGLLKLHRLALIDDVITTGATLQAAAQSLKAAHPTLEIHAWALAKTR
ncbi:phosphoribosyltransferase [Thiomicrospira aerophila AL3]|uniref:Phosphoribosyltransferase n=1 Tax=Thiomicrospira aerophila AL3 TaxID=717772 RepID=W0DTX0_9GAMM|nr:ComF family protein [Thiomicrospira aerophila]AHF02045.1 phosphoribosyltransferase [Thiomicrospira aerophila AL3]